MSGEERRQEIIHDIQMADKPLSASLLADRYHVSRQVIVQDIALLRAADHEILSTSKGYLCSRTPGVRRKVMVCHTDEEIEEEMNLIVDLGGRMLDVFIHHEVYGNFRADLSVSSRRQVQEFMEKLKRGESKPLKSLTAGVHGHTIEADSEQILDLIEEELAARGFLL